MTNLPRNTEQDVRTNAGDAELSEIFKEERELGRTAEIAYTIFRGSHQGPSVPPIPHWDDLPNWTQLALSILHNWDHPNVDMPDWAQDTLNALHTQRKYK